MTKPLALSVFLFFLSLNLVTASGDDVQQFNNFENRSFELSEGIRSLIVDLHNEARSSVVPIAANMQRLVYDTRLEVVARSHARKCTYGRSDPLSRGDAGESLEWSNIGESTALSVLTGNTMEEFVRESMGDFIRQKSGYDYYYPDRCVLGGICDNYKQVTWAATTNVGCAVQNCKKFSFDGGRKWLGGRQVYHNLVCNYGVGGNVAGVMTYEECTEPDGCPAFVGGAADGEVVVIRKPIVEEETKAETKAETKWSLDWATVKRKLKHLAEGIVMNLSIPFFYFAGW